ncbi:MAG: ferrous iron transport protein B [Clostridia bacterium]|nr:ferrous iron transport protein B [Clostridia bacterium]MBP3360101.1 ferrous iron transport protein B [Clostridia bacterium]
MSDISIAFTGNPNCGKTTLFNAYTGADLKVANWPGVTVEKVEGRIRLGDVRCRLVDLPGIYSLSSYTMEERVSREYILSGEAEVIINVTDASNLKRNLYLTLQLIELGKPMVLALNMMDILKKRNVVLDIDRLSGILGIPVVAVSAKMQTGLRQLMEKAVYEKTHFSYSTGMKYSAKIEEKITALTSMLRKKYPKMENYRWHAIKLLEHDGEICRKYAPLLGGIAEESCEAEIINEKYDFIEKILDIVLINTGKSSTFTDKADKIFTHNIWGIPIFLLIMSVVFFLTFTVGDFIKVFFEGWLESFSHAAEGLLRSLDAGEMITSLVVDGIIAGVGGILTFLPNIFILFLMLAFLEDSGYMSRAAYVMDTVMGRLGLSGRAFIPMLLGFGCSVPAIMASRTLEDKADRLKTIFMIPFMSCSAKLPVYVMLSQMFFSKYAALAAYSMYIIGFFTAILALLAVSRITGQKSLNGLLIELPEYKLPSLRTVSIYVKEKVKDYLAKAGTTIFAASVVLWFILNFGKNGLVNDISESFGAVAGRQLVPIMTPTGLGFWQIIVALIAGLAAKEVVVSSMSVLYGIGNISSQEGITFLAHTLNNSGFSALNAYSMMLFCLLYIPCIASIAAIKKETGSWIYTLSAIVMQLGLAWCVSTLFYQIGRMIL